MWGGILSRESSEVTEAEAVPSAEGNMTGAAMQGADTPSWSNTPSRMHWPISEQGEWLRQVMGGFFNYHAVPTNSRALAAFRYHVTVLWERTLRRRSQKDRTTWDRIAQLAEEWLPKPRILHPWPNVRFAVKHPR